VAASRIDSPASDRAAAEALRRSDSAAESPSQEDAPQRGNPSLADDGRGGLERTWAALRGKRFLAWVSSAAVHASLALLLACWMFSPRRAPSTWGLLGDVAGELPGEAEFALDPGDQTLLPALAAGPAADVLGGAASGGAATVPDPAAREIARTSDAGSEWTRGLPGLPNPLNRRGGGLSGRSGTERTRLALAGGGSMASEEAVERGLQWLAAHQLADGSWRFQLEQCPACQGACRNSGAYASTTAATGLALLCFLGAGQTHLDGRYQETVADGVYYLQQQMVVTSSGGDLRDHQRFRGAPALPGGAPLQAASLRFDTMYSHGIATLALTEAYAMTRDPGLQDPAQKAIDFIVNAQYGDGGWRYVPSPESPGPGDMTVSGWQIAALKSGLLAGLDVPYDIWERISAFLDTLQEDGGASYRYVRGEKTTAATNAIGLLCRMIAGWPRDARPLARGLAQAAGERPDESNMYCNFYASQVLHHAGGDLWKRWNERMREYLVETQAAEGHEAGSWYFAEPHSATGGRLYVTAMAIMTLEVYYRYLPLYGEHFIGSAP